MPIAASTLTAAILSQMKFRGLTGKNTFDLASSIGGAVARYITIPNLVTCTLSGVAGPIGSISSLSVVGLLPSAMSGLMLSRASRMSLTGRDIVNFFNAISAGVLQVLQTMFLSGTAVGCATGAGTGKFTLVNDQDISKLIFSELATKKLTGKNIRDLSDCISFGIAKHLLSSVTFTVIVSGVPVPVPPIGPVPVVGIPSLTTKVS